jgi:hypothetical protein
LYNGENHLLGDGSSLRDVIFNFYLVEGENG